LNSSKHDDNVGDDSVAKLEIGNHRGGKWCLRGAERRLL